MRPAAGHDSLRRRERGARRGRSSCLAVRVQSRWNSTEQDRLRNDVEAFCQALRPIEDKYYLERRFNDQVVPLAREHDLLGMPIPKAYGGRGADMVTYARMLARIGREGTGVRTFFSGHSSIGQGPILAWGTEEQKRRFLPPSARGEIRLCLRPDRARGRQQPARDDDDLSPPRRRVRPERREIPDLQRRDRRRDRHLRLSRGPLGADQRVPGRDAPAGLHQRHRSSPRSATSRPTPCGSCSATTPSRRPTCSGPRGRASRSRWARWSAAG